MLMRQAFGGTMMDPDQLLADINAISRGGVHRLEPGEEALRQLGTLSTKINQLIDHIGMGGRLPGHFTRHAEIRATVAKREAEQAGC